ncbi:EAL domain-containing protein [Cohnella fermenti]|uniref:EAL domain-containing protein n=1 Tax=Cohnella fermenti TaxID=2565925 RepID=A0A4S4C5U5_9BACL|nr:EAL domain-containing protein [Cohnella fermenti]THF83232.1 EAL domain-containing protein [Cohnella fermenti]
MDRMIAQRNFYHAFQPVMHLDNQAVFGYEALIRSETVASPDLLFKMAKEQNKLFELDLLSISRAMAVFFTNRRIRDSSEVLFLNVFPSSLADESFRQTVEEELRDYRQMAHRIIFEINEEMSQADAWNDERFIGNIRFLRRIGFRVAFDDVGDGATTFRNIIEIAPDFIKLDRYFGQKLSSSEQKQKVLRLFAEYCNNETGLILEGIEEAEDLAQARHLGVRLGQGFLLSEPRRLSDLIPQEDVPYHYGKGVRNCGR